MKERLEKEVEEIPECIFKYLIMNDFLEAVREGVDSNSDLLAEEKPFLTQLIYKRGLNLDGRYDGMKYAAEKVNRLSLVEV